MGWSEVYLLPQGSKMDPVAYAAKATEVLLSMGVIADDGYENEGWFGMGDEHLAPFDHGPDADYGFDYCVIYGKPSLLVVPADTGGIVEPRCPACGGDVGEPYFALVYDDEGNPTGHWQTNFDDARVTCPRCGGSFRMKDALGEGIYVTDKYVNFHDAIPQITQGWLDEFERAMGQRHLVRTYGDT
jgi:hypothetical protein